jgi:hypothetical protein
VAIDLDDFRDRFFALMGFVADVRTNPNVGNVSHSERSKEAFDASLFFRNLFGFLWSDVDLFLFLGRRFPEVSDPFSKPFTDLGEFSGTENNEDNDQDDNQLRHSYSKHFFSF